MSAGPIPARPCKGADVDEGCAVTSRRCESQGLVVRWQVCIEANPRLRHQHLTHLGDITCVCAQPAQDGCMRSSDSVRFAPYFKVQWWDDRALAWRDVQRSYPTQSAAEMAFVAGLVCRVMRVAVDGRAPVT